ncbi:MAG: hypothetical protein VYE22_27655 [Myxococcota bacterium]|nr:hypothetical protein [Myxococcota bacterium]
MSALTRLAAALTFCALLGVTAAADAQGSVDIRRPHTGSRPVQLDFHGGLSWWGWGAATGVRFGFPILENGFIPSINNAVYLNFGADFYWVRWRRNGSDWDYHAGLGLPVTLHWEFYFDERWSAFIEVGGQVFFHPRFFRGDPYDVYEGGYWFVAAAGGSFHINENVLLTLRVGSPYVAFGVTFQF